VPPCPLESAPLSVVMHVNYYNHYLHLLILSHLIMKMYRDFEIFSKKGREMFTTFKFS